MSLFGFDGVVDMVGAVLGAVVSIVQVREAVGPTLAAASTRRTSIVCAPSASSGVVYEARQAVHAPPSRRHWYVSSPAAPRKANADCPAVTKPDGPEAITGADAGGARSTIHVVEVGVPTLPAASICRICTVCAPSPSVPVANGLVHGTHAPVSSLHSVATASPVRENDTVADVCALTAAGLPVTLAAPGGTRSTIQLTLVDTLALPALSTARVSSVWLPAASPEYDEAQGAQAPPSSRHSSIEPASLVKVNSAVVSFVGLSGCVAMPGAAGAVVSTVHTICVTSLATAALLPTFFNCRTMTP